MGKCGGDFVCTCWRVCLNIGNCMLNVDFLFVVVYSCLTLRCGGRLRFVVGWHYFCFAGLLLVTCYYFCRFFGMNVDCFVAIGLFC